MTEGKTELHVSPTVLCFKCAIKFNFQIFRDALMRCLLTVLGGVLVVKVQVVEQQVFTSLR